MSTLNPREIVAAIAQIPVTDHHITDAQGEAIARLFKGNVNVFRELDEKPGLFGYNVNPETGYSLVREAGGVEWHYKLRQARNGCKRFFEILSGRDAYGKALADMGYEPDHLLDAREVAQDENETRDTTWNQHIAIQWEGGVLWLNLMALRGGDDPHYCVDIRSFQATSDVAVPQGVMAWSEGFRHELENRDALPKAHGFPASALVCLLTDAPKGA